MPERRRTEAAAETAPAGETVGFKDVYKGSLDSEGGLEQLADSTFEIISFERSKIALGDVYLVNVEAEGAARKLHTFSKVLQGQLDAIEPTLVSGKRVRVTLKKVKRYMTFE